MAVEVRDLVLILGVVSDFSTPDGVGGYADDIIPLLGIVIGVVDGENNFLVVETGHPRYGEQYPDRDKVITLAKKVPEDCDDPTEALQILLPQVAKHVEFLGSAEQRLENLRKVVCEHCRDGHPWDETYQSHVLKGGFGGCVARGTEENGPPR